MPAARGAPQLFPVLYRLWTFYFLRGELQTGRELTEQLMRVAQSVRDPSLLARAHVALGWTLYNLGELTSAWLHAEQALVLYDPQLHPRSDTPALDPRVDCLCYATWAPWILGYPDQALKRNHEALALAKELSHPFSLAYALGSAAMLHCFRREGQLAQERAEAVITLATEQGLPFWQAWGTMVQGWALAEQGQVQEGVAKMRQMQTLFTSALLAEAYSAIGRIEEGLTVLAERLAFVDRIGIRVSEAELYRVNGELTLQQLNVQGSKFKEAEECFHKAIEIAGKQQAKSLELRAMMSLARLWQRQGKQHEAHIMLAEIYNWFTEGFDTKDLQEAKALLEELSH